MKRSRQKGYDCPSAAIPLLRDNPRRILNEKPPPIFADPTFRAEVHSYIGGITRRLDCPSIAIGGGEDHVHNLVRLSRTIAIAEWVKEVKRVSPAFAKERASNFAWQAGYGVFSVDSVNLDRIAAYVRNQEDHHRKTTFQDEFRLLMSEHSVEWDERYVWD